MSELGTCDLQKTPHERCKYSSCANWKPVSAAPTVESLEAQIAVLVKLSERQSAALASALYEKNQMRENLYNQISANDRLCAENTSLRQELAALKPPAAKFRVGQLVQITPTTPAYSCYTPVPFYKVLAAMRYSPDGWVYVDHANRNYRETQLSQIDSEVTR